MKSQSILPASCTSSCLMLMIWSSRARNRSPDPVASCFFGRIAPSDAATESCFSIRGNRENEFASFQGLRHGNLAISSQQSRQKTTLAQWVRNSSQATDHYRGHRGRRARRRAGHWPWPQPGEAGAFVRTILYDKAKWDGHGTFDLSLDRRSPWRTAVGDRARITGCGLSVCDTCSAGVISRWSCCNQSEPGAPPPPFKPRRSSEGE